MKIIFRKSKKNGQFYFFFQASNGRNMGKETYTQRAGAVKAAKSIVEAIVLNKYQYIDETKPKRA